MILSQVKLVLQREASDLEVEVDFFDSSRLHM